jgi:hypothetical protein
MPSQGNYVKARNVKWFSPRAGRIAPHHRAIRRIAAETRMSGAMPPGHKYRTRTRSGQ